MSKRKPSPQPPERVPVYHFNEEEKTRAVRNYMAMNEMMAKEKEAHEAKTRLIIGHLEKVMKGREDAWRKRV